MFKHGFLKLPFFEPVNFLVADILVFINAAMLCLSIKLKRSKILASLIVFSLPFGCQLIRTTVLCIEWRAVLLESISQIQLCVNLYPFCLLTRTASESFFIPIFLHCYFIQFEYNMLTFHYQPDRLVVLYKWNSTNSLLEVLSRNINLLLMSK